MNADAAPPGADPVRQRHIDALQRRAAHHQGEARRVIEARLRQLREQAAPLAVVALQANGPATAGLVTAAAVPAGPGPLSALLAHIQRQAAPGGELKAVRAYRSTWARLGVAQRLAQTLAKVPDNAGPLNTQRLLHQALTVMRQASPSYLLQFMQHVDSLLALDQLGAPPQPPKKDGARGPKGR